MRIDRIIHDALLGLKVQYGILVLAFLVLFGYNAISSDDAQSAAEQDEITAQMIDAVHGGPVRFDDRQLNRLAVDMSSYYEENGDLEGYSGQPNFYIGISKHFGMDVFAESNVCEDCGSLDFVFRGLMEDPEQAELIRADIETVESESALQATLNHWPFFFGYWVGATTLTMIFACHMNTKGVKAGWRDVRWMGTHSGEKQLRIAAPVYFYIVYPIVSRRSKKFEAILEEMGLLRTYKTAINTLKDIKGTEQTPQVKEISQRLNDVVDEITFSAAQYDSTLETADKTDKALTIRAEKLSEELQVQMEARRLARQELQNE